MLSAPQVTYALLVALRARWWVAVLVTLVSLGLALALVDRSDLYRAQAALTASAAPEPEALAAAGGRFPAAPTSAAAALTDGVLVGLSREVRRSTPPTTWRAELAVAPAANGVLTLTAQRDDRASAIAAVNAWATVLVKTRNNQLTNAFTDARVVLTRREGRARQRGDDATATRVRAQRVALARARTSLEPDLTVTSAAASAIPVTRRSLAVIVAGALLAGIVALGLVLALERRLWTPDVAAAAFGLPVLATVRGRGDDADDVQAGVSLHFHAGGTDAEPGAVLITPATRQSAEAAESDARLVARTLASAGTPAEVVRWNVAASGSGEDDAPEAVVEGRWPVLAERVKALQATGTTAVVLGPPVTESGDVLFAGARLTSWFLPVDLRRTRVGHVTWVRRVLNEERPLGLVVHGSRKGTPA